MTKNGDAEAERVRTEKVGENERKISEGGNRTRENSKKREK